MRFKKVLSTVLACAMALSLAACGSSNTPASQGGSSSSTDGAKEESTQQSESGNTAEEGMAALDTSERVDFVFYVMGDAPADEVMVEDLINEVLLEKFNATIDFQFSTWTDFQQKYSLEMTSGNADIIYIASWLNYGQLAASGAFEELDELLPDYAPELINLFGQDKLNMCKVGGNIYAIPNAWDEWTCNGFKYREDLRELYDLPVPNTLENVEAYFDGIMENMPNQGILTVTTEESQNLQVAFDAAWVLNMKYDWVYTNGLPYGLASNYGTPADVYDYWFSDDFVEDMYMLKRWADKGYWSKSALSNTNDSEAYRNGLCVVELAGQNPNKQIAAVNDFEKDGNGWKSEYIAYGEVTGALYPAHATQNGTALVRGCKDPARAIAVLNELFMNKELNQLMQTGIEGVHYEMTGDGFYKELGEKFLYEGFNTWNMRNAEYMVPKSSDVLLNEMFDGYADLAKSTKTPGVNIYDGFSEDYDSYAPERQAVFNIMQQYLSPLQAGLVADVDAAIEEFRTKVKEAGLDKCREEFQAQWAAYCDEYGYK